MRRRIVVLAVAWFVLLALCAGLFQWMIWPAPFKRGEGSTSYARKWKERFESTEDPETAQARFGDVTVKRFDNGEWIFGVCADSHSSIHGGTVVVKDSRGNTHVYFGHVCGPKALELALESQRSLEGFYHSEWLLLCGFTEYTGP
jgi:hypothetical protein